MISERNFAAAVTVAAMLLASTAAQASDQYSFPSPGGALIAASATNFIQQTPTANPEANGVAPTLGGSVTVSGANANQIPRLPVASPDYRERFGMRSQSGDAYSYRFLTHALASASFANYAADYYRLFAPGYAVTTWTERMAGLVDVGYGGAVDGWTAGAYYLGRLRGPAHRRETAPDLSTMPTFRAHPELEQNPTFTQPGN